MFRADLEVRILDPVGSPSIDSTKLEIADQICHNHTGLFVVQHILRCIYSRALWCPDHHSLLTEQRSRTFWVDNNDRSTLL